MNSTDLHTLLTNPPVSRTTFFTQLLAEPRPHSEPPLYEGSTDTTAKPTAATDEPDQSAATNFPA